MIEIIENDGNEYWTDLVYRQVRRDMYEISTLGNVRRKDTGKLLSISKSEKGYLQIGLMSDDKTGNNKTFKLHRIVAVNWLGDYSDEGLEVNHQDGNKDDCSCWNLEWTTRAGNIRHGFDKGLIPAMRGESNGMAKYDEPSIRLICSLMEIGLSNRKISRVLKRAGYEINKSFRYYLFDIRHRRKWPHVTREYDY